MTTHTLKSIHRLAALYSILKEPNLIVFHVGSLDNGVFVKGREANCSSQSHFEMSLLPKGCEQIFNSHQLVS